MNAILLCIVAFALAGCVTSVTYPVQGKTDGGVNSGVRFLGSATTYMNDTGTVHLVSDAGVVCNGKYTVSEHLITGSVNGTGTLTCSNGLTGTFALVGSATSGDGFGKLSDGTKFTFVFGNVINVIHQ